MSTIESAHINALLAHAINVDLSVGQPTTRLPFLSCLQPTGSKRDGRRWESGCP